MVTEQTANSLSIHSAVWLRGFWSLFAAPFQGTSSGNDCKLLVMFFILGGWNFTTDERDRLAPTVSAQLATKPR
ncbi:MAG: hypothetical protein O3B24_03280 [Verrucomicrobia bacterium]|nr:hypothetical protein [Verrucomicrobiota bacterium]